MQRFFKFFRRKILSVEWVDYSLQTPVKELTGLDPDVCSVCGQNKLILLGHIPDVHLPPGRSPPLQINIYTPEGEIIPLAV